MCKFQVILIMFIYKLNVVLYCLLLISFTASVSFRVSLIYSLFKIQLSIDKYFNFIIILSLSLLL